MNFPKMSFTSREKALVVIIIFVLIYFLFDFTMFEPKRKETQKIKNEIESIDRKIQENFQGVSTPADITGEIALLEKKSRLLNRILSGSEKPDRFFKNLSELCRKHSIELISLKPRETAVSKADYRHLFIEMKLRCNFRAVVLFMRELTSLNVFSTVNILKLHRDDDSSQLTLNLVIETFFPCEKQQKTSMHAKKTKLVTRKQPAAFG